MDEENRIQFLEGLELFNQEKFYECHDAIEEIWLQESSDEQLFLQGIIQSAVALHHYQHGNWGAARSMFELAIEKLKGYPEIHHGIRLKEFLNIIGSWKAVLDQSISDRNINEVLLPYPKITFES